MIRLRQWSEIASSVHRKAGQRSTRRLCAFALAVTLLLTGVPVASAAPDGISAELNRLEQVEDACRMSVVFSNRLDAAIETLTLETVLFDQSQQVARFLLLTAKPLPAGKIRVQQFDIGGLSCDSISRVLLNDVTVCEGPGLDPATCLDAVVSTSRAEVPFLSGIADTGQGN